MTKASSTEHVRAQSCYMINPHQVLDLFQSPVLRKANSCTFDSLNGFHYIVYSDWLFDNLFSHLVTSARLYDVEFPPVGSPVSSPWPLRKKKVKMKKKQSPKKTGKEYHIPKAQRGSNETIDVKRCLEPAILALRKVSTKGRPPTPIEVENRLSDQVLGPVFVPNKFMNGSQNYTHYARTVPSASWSANRSPIISKLEVKPSNFSEVYRASKTDAALAGSLPAVDKKAALKLSNEEFKSTKRASFLPKIDGKSKTNSGSFHNVVAVEQAIKRSPQTSSEMIKLPPANVGNSNITCKENSSSKLASLDKTVFKNSSPEDAVKTAIVPKPPSVSNIKDKSNARKRTKRRKEEEQGTLKS